MGTGEDAYVSFSHGFTIIAFYANWPGKINDNVKVCKGQTKKFFKRVSIFVAVAFL